MDSSARARHKQGNRGTTNRDHRWQLTGPICVRTGLSIFPSPWLTILVCDRACVHVEGITWPEKSIKPGSVHQKPGHEAAEPADGVRPTCIQTQTSRKHICPHVSLAYIQLRNMHSCMHPPPKQPRGMCMYTPCPIALSQPCVYVSPGTAVTQIPSSQPDVR